MKFYLLLLILITNTASANLVINEVLSNEPGSSTSLEWFELQNNSDTTMQLSDYILVINSDTIILPSRIIPPNSYLIICKQLFWGSNNNSFESYWGNGTNVWGDSEYEFLTPEPIELSFSLSNNFGTIQLLQNLNIVSTFSWEEKGADAFSWERKYTDSLPIMQSISKIGSTPGYLNSVTPVEKDLAVELYSLVMENFNPIYRFTITNRGLTDITDGMLHIYDSSFTTLTNSTNIPLIQRDSVIEIETILNYTPVQLYETLTAIVATPFDLRTTNDTIYFTAVSQQYPPIIISEFLANPQGDKHPEWVEIYNRSNEQIDLQNWSIGDSVKSNQVTTQSFFVAPNQFIVLTKSKVNFLNEYPQFNGIVFELDSWAVLNNESDKLKLLDDNNIVADNYSYDMLYDDNYTVSRNLENGLYDWGRSSDQYGTPGYENSLSTVNNNSSVAINLSSKYISPDGDGFEDELRISINVPQSDSYTLKLYDINGNIVHTFYPATAYISNEFVWNGLSSDNVRLPIGIYILYLSTEEGLSTKETIVIAR